jgi:sugar O-acyltransferase (sialic acid O-acetyltransferase NeuD family)
VRTDDPESVDVYVVGAGGHAKVIVYCLACAGRRAVGVFDDDPARLGQIVAGVPVLGTTAELGRFPRRPAIIAIGNNRVRQRLAEQLTLPWLTVIHPRAWVDPTASIGQGTMIVAGAVVQCDARIGHHVIVNTSATVDHDAVIQDFVHLCPGVHIPGDVTIEMGVTMGTGSQCVPGVRVGMWSTIGAGAVVVADVPEQVTAAGVPARILRPA